VRVRFPPAPHYSVLRQLPQSTARTVRRRSRSILLVSRHPCHVRQPLVFVQGQRGRGRPEVVARPVFPVFPVLAARARDRPRLRRDLRAGQGDGRRLTGRDDDSVRCVHQFMHEAVRFLNCRTRSRCTNLVASGACYHRVRLSPIGGHRGAAGSCSGRRNAR
jgi:hypothetical protein